MPGIEDWQTRPHSTIQHIFEEHGGESHEEFVKKVSDYFTQRLTDETWHKIPSINSVPLDQLRSGLLVKYRCMVQDVFDPQFCLDQYKVTNTSTNSSRVECGLFRDIPNLQPNETADFDGKDSRTVQRQGFYCVPIPGEAEWVKQMYSDGDLTRNSPSSSSSSRIKRSREECDPSEIESEQKLPKDELFCDGKISGKQGHELSSQINVAEVETGSQRGSNLTDLNLPLPGEKGVSCIVRVYSEAVELKATDAVEFVGILCMDPGLASVFDSQVSEEMGDQEEMQAHEPPASLVPRLHALVTRHLEHNNPALPFAVSSDKFQSEITKLMLDAASIRIELLSILEHVLFNDRLAAEYLLCHLISGVYARADVLPLGKLSLNISGCSPSQRYSKFLHHLISQLTPQSVYVEMSIDNCNTMCLIPKKDYKRNRITAGMLQLANGTHLFLDETALHQGQLNSTGMSNLKALADVIRWQKVDYDFQWHPVTMHTDINVLTISEGESLLPKDAHVPLTPSSTTDQNTDVAQHFSKLDARLTGDCLEKLRSYVTACRLIKYSVSDEVQKMIQEDFVETRQGNPKEMSVEDFQRLLGLVRVYCMSHGQASPNIDMWKMVRAMEEERKVRISRLPGSDRGAQ